MSVLVERSMGELNGERKPVYPLFQKGAKPCAIHPRQEELQATLNTTVGEATFSAPSQNTLGTITKKTKKATNSDVSNAMVGSISSSSSPANVPTAYDRAELLDVDPNSGRRKRLKSEEGKPALEEIESQTKSIGQLPQRPPQRQLRQRKLPGVDRIPSAQKGVNLDLKANVLSGETEIPEDLSYYAVIQGAGEGQTQYEPPNPVGSSPREAFPTRTEGSATAVLKEAPVEGSASSTHHRDGSHNEVALTKLAEAKQKKVLRLNPKTGTIGSPPAKKPLPATEKIGKKALGQRKKVKSRGLTIRYGHGERLPPSVGLKIDYILNKAQPVVSLQSKPPIAALKSQNSGPAKPAKTLHPLFLNKTAAKTSPRKLVQKDNTVIDLTQSKALAFLERSRLQSSGNSSPTKLASTTFSGFGLSAKITKFPGAVGPAWPWKGMIHIRGIDPNEPYKNLVSTTSVLQARKRKSKYQAIEVSPAESIVVALATDLSIHRVAKDIREISPDEYPPVPTCLRVPTKHYESGLSIQRRVLKELHTLPVTLTTADQSSSEDEIRVIKKTRALSYPASLSKIYASIPNSFSAFDYGQCETQAWINKYAPRSADEVLQAGTEVQILKTWLQTLTVKSVEAGLGDRSLSRASSMSRRSKSSKAEKPGKRKRKPKNVDDFIVSTDEEGDDMDEITEPEDEISPSRTQDLLKKTVIRAGDAVAMGSKEPGKLTNAVVISGPNGCGKTAAVYAVAKELGFEVFEINSSSRRNGKDIIEKVGDMTRNHQVQRTSDLPVDVIDEDKQRIDDALADDLKSGRQGTMNSFFKPKQPTKSKSKAKNATPLKKPAETQVNISKPTAKQQKQSLILIEEVDILYKEDTQFWATILSMIATSKRPIIMTCNDESAVPISSLTVHAIIRFTFPPIDLGVDYLLLVAACEGHVLRREAVKALYESRHLDLRASLMELNFWCQFAVGDVKRGLDWYYPRWSRGRDIDNKGNTIRVVSEGTYETGMGWLSQDYLESDNHHLDIEEELLHEAYNGWHIDVGDWQKHNSALPMWATRIRSLSGGKNDDRAALGMYADFAEAMSSADLFSGSTFALDNQIDLDFSLPELSQKVKDDYVLAHDLLEATPLVSYDSLNKEICLWMRSRNRKYLQVDQHVDHNFDVPTELARPSEADFIRLITTQATKPEVILTRKDLSLAFDPIAEPEKLWPLNPTVMELCSFDRTTALITEDLAPYIRSIVAYDARLQLDRAKLSNLLSEGGRPGKRMRTTRAAMSALEGGTRNTTRRDRWFTGKVNSYFVMRTGMQSWSDAEAVEAKKRAEEMATSVIVSAGEIESSDEHCE